MCNTLLFIHIILYVLTKTIVEISQNTHKNIQKIKSIFCSQMYKKHKTAKICTTVKQD